MKFKRSLSTRAIIFACFALVIFLSSCAQPEDEGFQEIESQLEELAQKRSDYQEELSQMNTAQLFEILQQESIEGKEPYNSMAYSELVSRGEQAAPELQSLLRNDDQSSLLGLLALREMDQTLYRQLDSAFRINVLVDALQNSKYFNTWGLPHLYWEEAAQSIIDEGEAAQEPLMLLLDDTRPAPMWGEEEVVESNAYAYRVRDYAWALILAIRGNDLAIPTDPAQRDELIKEMQS
ncbi:MAG: hypothetical protein ACK2UF_19340 [Candidatus Promineifilaceae bacterium]|jgi:hypothetical protein